MARSGDMDQASPVGEAEVHSDGDQSTDTDEEGMEGSTMLMDKDSPIPQISFEADKNTGNFTSTTCMLNHWMGNHPMNHLEKVEKSSFVRVFSQKVKHFGSASPLSSPNDLNELHVQVLEHFTCAVNQCLI